MPESPSQSLNAAPTPVSAPQPTWLNVTSRHTPPSETTGSKRKSLEVDWDPLPYEPPEIAPIAQALYPDLDPFNCVDCDSLIGTLGLSSILEEGEVPPLVTRAPPEHIPVSWLNAPEAITSIPPLGVHQLPAEMPFRSPSWTIPGTNQLADSGLGDVPEHAKLTRTRSLYPNRLGDNERIEKALGGSSNPSGTDERNAGPVRSVLLQGGPHPLLVWEQTGTGEAQRLDCPERIPGVRLDGQGALERTFSCHDQARPGGKALPTCHDGSSRPISSPDNNNPYGSKRMRKD